MSTFRELSPIMRQLALIISLIWKVLAAPQVAFPFNSQVPLVARIGQPYNFTFSQTTFTPDGADFIYILEGAPAWLTLDSPRRTLYGTPGAADIGSPIFTITASDQSGRVSMSATLVVVSNPEPLASVDVASVLAPAGKLSGPDAITLAPKATFSFNFPFDTFSPSGGALSIYATLSDHTPLPSWLAFDPANLRFSGTAPTLSYSPQDFDVFLIASDVPGFAGTWVPFSLVISFHEFYFQDVASTVHAEPGQPFTVLGIREQLVLDGKPPSSDDLTDSVPIIPSWLSFDEASMSFNGLPPQNFSSQSISLAVHDRFGDIANKTIKLQVSSGLLADDWPTLNATLGAHFHYVLPQVLLEQPNLQLTMDFGAASHWLHFDAATLSLDGTVPLDIPSGVIDLQLTAQTQDGSKKDTRKLELRLQAAPSPSSASTIRTRSNSSVSSPTGGVFAATGTPENANGKKTAGIVVGVVIAILFLIFCLVLAVLYFRSPKRGVKRSRSALKHTISGPIVADADPWSTSMNEEGVDLEKGPNDIAMSSNDPPQIQLSISPFKKTRRSGKPNFTTITAVPQEDFNLPGPSHHHNRSMASSTLNNDDTKILDNINRSSWGYMGARRPHDSMKLATEIARQSRQMEETSPLENRQISRLASNTCLSLRPNRRSTPLRVTSGGLPANPRLAGLGHGRSPSNRSSFLGLLQMQQQTRIASYTDSVSTRSTSLLFSPRMLASVPPIRFSKQPSYLDLKRRSRQELSMFNTQRLSVQRPVSRRDPHRSAFFSSRGSSSSRNRNTMLGLSTIDASPDLGMDSDSAAADSSDALGIRTTRPSHQHGRSNSSEKYHPLRRNPTKTSEKTATTWRATTTNETFESNQTQNNALPIPNHDPRYKQWSSQLRTRLNRPISSHRHESSLFASADEANSGDERHSNAPSSFYSQSHQSSIFVSATPSPEREKPAPLRPKLPPTGGVRVPPFTSSAAENIMDRPHPRFSIRKASGSRESTPQKRMPLGRVRGGENRLSGGVLGEYSGGWSGPSTGFKGKMTMRPKLRSAKGKRPMSVDDVGGEGTRSVKGSMVSRVQSMSPSPSRGNEYFL